jgi:CRP-like cAMP-binding protein
MKSFRMRPVGGDDCARCPAHKVDLFGGLQEDERLQLLRFFRIEDWAQRGVIYNEGERGESVYILRAGVVKHVRISASGDDRIVRLSLPGDALGLNLLAGGAYGTTAVAVTPVNLCRIPMSMVEACMHKYPEFGLRVVRESQAQLRNAQEVLTDLSTGTAHERVARLLLFLGQHVGEGNCLMLTREDMGALLGITTETASRVIAEFKRAGVLVEADDGKVNCNRDRLAALAAV